MTQRTNPREQAARNVEIYRLRESGVSYAKIGKQFGISATRAKQIHYREIRRATAKADGP